MVLFRMDPLRNGSRLSSINAVIGMCDDIRKQGWKICVNPNLHIRHPDIEWVV